MLGAASTFGHSQMQIAIKAINEFAAKPAARPSDWTPARNDARAARAIEAAVGTRFAEAFQIRDKLARRDAVLLLKSEGQGARRPNRLPRSG